MTKTIGLATMLVSIGASAYQGAAPPQGETQAIEQAILADIRANHQRGVLGPTCDFISQVGDTAIRGIPNKTPQDIRAEIANWPNTAGIYKTLSVRLLDLALVHSYERKDFDRLEIACWEAI